MTINVGVLTAGGDTPGLNAALRGLGKSAEYCFDLQLVGFYDGFRGLLHDRSILLDESTLSGILTLGGTILGTSRDKPRKMLVGGKWQDYARCHGGYLQETSPGCAGLHGRGRYAEERLFLGRKRIECRHPCPRRSIMISPTQM